MSTKKPRIKTFSVYASVDIFNKINMIAKKNDRNRNQQIVRFLKQGIAKNNIKKPESSEN